MGITTFHSGTGGQTAAASSAALLAEITLWTNNYKIEADAQKTQADFATENGEATISMAQHQAKATRMDGYRTITSSAVGLVGTVASGIYQYNEGKNLTAKNQSMQNMEAFQQEFSSLKVEGLQNPENIGNYIKDNNIKLPSDSDFNNFMNKMQTGTPEERVAAFKDLTSDQIQGYAVKAHAQVVGMDSVDVNRLQNDSGYAEEFNKNSKNKRSELNGSVDTLKNNTQREFNQQNAALENKMRLSQSFIHSASELSASPFTFFKAHQELLQGMQQMLTTLYSLQVQNDQSFIRSLESSTSNAQELANATIQAQAQVSRKGS